MTANSYWLVTKNRTLYYVSLVFVIYLHYKNVIKYVKK